MKVNIEGLGELKVSFRHNPENTAAIGESNGVLFAAHANLAKGDRYCKAIGRKVALTRMLGDWPMPFTREQRAKVWSAYFAQHADLRRGK